MFLHLGTCICFFNFVMGGCYCKPNKIILSRLISCGLSAIGLKFGLVFFYYKTKLFISLIRLHNHRFGYNTPFCFCCVFRGTQVGGGAFTRWRQASGRFHLESDIEPSQRTVCFTPGIPLFPWIPVIPGKFHLAPKEDIVIKCPSVKLNCCNGRRRFCIRREEG